MHAQILTLASRGIRQIFVDLCQLLLLGRTEKVSKLGHIAQLIWKCFDGDDVFSKIFTIPYILSTTKLLQKIRNYRFKIYPPDSMIPAEVWKYDTRSILEGLHNSVVRQDFTPKEQP